MGKIVLRLVLIAAFFFGLIVLGPRWASAQCVCGAIGPGGYGPEPWPYTGSYVERPIVTVRPSQWGVPYIDNYGIGPFADEEPYWYHGRFVYRRLPYSLRSNIWVW
jgi:hypothetical protein